MVSGTFLAIIACSLGSAMLYLSLSWPFERWRPWALLRASILGDVFVQAPRTATLAWLFAISGSVVLYQNRAWIPRQLRFDMGLAQLFSRCALAIRRVPGRLLSCGVLVLVLVGYVSGVALFLLEGWPVDSVRPWTFWALVWEGPSETALQVRLLQSSGIGIAFCALFVGLLVVKRREPLHGDARFTRLWELSRLGLRDRSGLLLGRAWNRDIRNGDHFHALIAAPTGSGKGVGFVVPNCLRWEDSILVLDIKGENYALTSRHRAKQGPVFKFSPMNPHTHRWNPLDAIRPEIQHRITDVQQLATILIPIPQGKGGTRMWEQEAQSLFVGLALYVLDTPEIPSTIGEIARLLKTDRELSEVIELWMEAREHELDPACIRALNNFRHKAPKERSGVKSTLTAELALWENPVVDAATEQSDCRFSDLRRKRMSLFVEVTIAEIETCERILNLFFQQAMAVLTRSLPKKDEPYRVLFLLDEFASLGRMDVLAKAIPFLRGYGARIALVVQGLGQLETLYDAAGAQNIIQNTGIQVFFTSNDEKTSRYISEACGTKTVYNASRSYPTGLQWNSGSRSVSVARRELVMRQDVRWMDGTRGILLKEGSRPTRITKIRHYEDPDYTNDIAEPVPVPALEIHRGVVRKFEGATRSQREEERNHETAAELGRASDMISTLLQELDS